MATALLYRFGFKLHEALPFRSLRLGPSAARALKAALGVVTLLGVLAMLSPARAQVQPGQIGGLVTRDVDGAPLPGTTVVISGPALQGEQTEVTDRNGRYLITQLPSGDGYVVRFYFADLVVERPGVRIGQNKTLTINVQIATQQQARQVQVIRERAPNVDTASASSGVELNQELLQSSALRGRTFESALQLAPGAVDAPRGLGGDVGVSLSGSTGVENNFLIDGLNTSDPNTGVLSTQLHQSFIKEINVITSGYQAEYGRATGGIISIVTKGGSNEFHGSVFGSVNPFQLEPSTVARLGESLGLRTRSSALGFDVGFELGGPIVKDRIWFYIGFAPTLSQDAHEREVRRQVLDGSGQPRSLPCTRLGYLAFDTCQQGLGSLATETAALPDRTQPYTESTRLYNGVAKLQFNLSANHNITLSYIASPTESYGYGVLRPFLYANVPDKQVSTLNQQHDASARYTGKLLQRRLQLDVMYGFHYQGQHIEPANKGEASFVYFADRADPYSLSDFEDVPECRRQPLPGGGMSNPCPLTQYRRGGYGPYSLTVLLRHQLLASATMFVSAGGRHNPLRGTHALKLGADFEYLSYDNNRFSTGPDLDPGDPFSGHTTWQTSPDGLRLRRTQQYGVRAADGSGERLDSYRSVTATRNVSLYLRDSWTVGWVPGLVVNAGLRWEAQEIFDQLGNRQVGIYDNLAPRIGITYDATGKGRSKLYASYGRFYESLPLSINDRAFAGRGAIVGPNAANCPRVPLTPGGRPLPVPQSAPGAPCSVNSPQFLIAGDPYLVEPGVKGQYLDEVSAGLMYDVGLDFVLGVGYVYRTLGSVVEDVGVDATGAAILGNPGAPIDEAQVRTYEQRIAELRRDSSPAAQAELMTVQRQLAGYRAISSTTSRATRNYHALVLTAQKRLSNRFSVLASYTFSRTLGNYPGPYDAHTRDFAPNISLAFDSPDLATNRNGPLPTDRPHNVKLLGTYIQPLGQSGSLTVSITGTAFSGRPINVLGGHPLYGGSQVFILPRGSGGRTPIVTQLDLHVGYEHKFAKLVALLVFADVINLLNQQQVTSVDDDYTYSVVGPIRNGKAADLAHLRAEEGQPLVLNSNYGQPTAYQAPLYMRLGARLSF